MAAGVLQALVDEPFQTPRRCPRPTGQAVREAATARRAVEAEFADRQLVLDLDLTQPVRPTAEVEVEVVPPPAPTPAPGFDHARAAALFAWAQHVGGPAAMRFTEAFEDLLLADHHSHNRVVWQRRGHLVRLNVTSTPLGWSSGYHYESLGTAACEGGGVEPCWDETGAFFWESRESAYHAAGRAVILVALSHGDDRASGHVRSFLVARGLDGDREPDPVLKVRFVSRVEIAAAVEPPLDGQVAPDPDARRAFERAEGLTDVDLPPPGPPPAPVRRPRTPPPCDRLATLVSEAGVGPRGLAADRGFVLAVLDGAAPPGAAAPASEVLRARTSATGTIARVRLTDGSLGRLWIGQDVHGAQALAWHADPPGYLPSAARPAPSRTRNTETGGPTP